MFKENQILEKLDSIDKKLGQILPLLRNNKLSNKCSVKKSEEEK